MFMGPLERDKPWSDEGIQGVHRFLKRVWALFITENGELHPRIVKDGGDTSMLRVLHHTMKEVTNNIEGLLFNTAIARMMEFVNAALKVEKVDRDVMDKFVLILSPFAPHMGEELWERLGHDNTLAYESWPQYDETMLVEDTIEIPVQVNGKLRAVITVPAAADKNAILAAAKADPKVEQHIQGKTIVKEVFVPGKLVSIVVK
jgi:leucyl-tRNA synthetase